MKNLVLTVFALCLAGGAAAQTTEKTAPEGYRFTDVKILPVTSVKDQSRSGTCWCYSTLSFLESEILRAGGPELDLSEMWIVRNIYFEKAVKYVRLHGSLNLAVGGQAHDVTGGIQRYGIVPEEVYPGLNYGYDKPNFDEIDAVIKAYADAVIAAASKRRDGSKLTTAWQAGLNGILDAYFGAMPEKFTYEGKEYTPASFAASLPIDMNDYIEFSSFTHHPFYTEFAMEVPDSWNWDKVWNVPLDEFMRIIDSSLEKGYTIAWGTDVSEKGFSRTKGLGIIPEADLEGMEGTEAEKWGKLTQKEKEAALYNFEKPGKERTITQELRQEGYDNYETTDDHGMQIVGTAVDQNGTPYYKVKNSWAQVGPYDGYWYFSRPFVAYKTMTVLVNKNGVPKEILKKIGLK
ncbi:MAG: C1 family peptidase [Alistipes senegalensis]|uniref:aminopeptidase C n=1 Tax=Alistipes senegalensis TaxID=1288121 RepID=UPI002432DEC1|nr:C1 family peptidase [Alistipes senegalensis]MDD7038567.1 C1 family peptidase [Alistipes senegalensis]